MDTVLVTGGAGFVGGCFVRQAIADNAFRVVNLDKLTYAGNLDSLQPVIDNPNHIFVQGDIADHATVSRLLEEYQPLAILNFAAETHVDRSIDSPDQFVQTNVLGTFWLLEATRQYWNHLTEQQRDRFRFLHISTDEVYGSLGPTGQFAEHAPYAPNSPYAASKAGADHLVRAYHRTYRLPTLVTNCSNNYGPYQLPDQLIPLMILNALAGEPLPVYGDGSNMRDWVFVEDHCRALRAVLEHGLPGEVYNVGGNSERTNLEVVEAVCAVVDRLAPESFHAPRATLITFVEDRPGHDRRYAIDTDKVYHELGWEPEVTFEAGLERTVRWYLDNHAWVERVSSRVHRHERMGLAHAGH